MWRFLQSLKAFEHNHLFQKPTLNVSAALIQRKTHNAYLVSVGNAWLQKQKKPGKPKAGYGLAERERKDVRMNMWRF